MSRCLNSREAVPTEHVGLVVSTWAPFPARTVRIFTLPLLPAAMLC